MISDVWYCNQYRKTGRAAGVACANTGCGRVGTGPGNFLRDRARPVNLQVSIHAILRTISGFKPQLRVN